MNQDKKNQNQKDAQRDPNRRQDINTNRPDTGKKEAPAGRQQESSREAGGGGRSDSSRSQEKGR